MPAGTGRRQARRCPLIQDLEWPSQSSSAPGSSGKFSSTTTDKSTPRSVSLNGSIVSEAIVEDDEDDGGNKANGSRSADDTDDSG